jgi:hypothetical protein
MIRILAYIVCLAGILWLAIESVRFRQAIRNSLQTAYSQLDRVVPDRADDAGKVLNSYYEDVYLHLPSTFWPAGILMVGSTILLMVRMPRRAEPTAPPNGGPATRFAGSRAAEGPPSVS